MTKYNRYQTFVDDQPPNKQPLLADAAPPLSNQHPPKHDHKKTTTNSPPPPSPPALSECCVVFLFFLTLIVLILGTVQVIVTLNTPDGYVFYPYIQLNSFSVTGFNQTSQISGDWDFDFSAANFNIRDELIFKVSHVTVSLLHKNQEVPIWVTPVPSFNLSPKSVKAHIPGKFSGTSEFLNNPAAKAIADGVKGDGKVRFDVALESYTQYGEGRGLLMALCKDVDFFISGDTRRGRMTSGTADCRVSYETIVG